MEKFLFELMQPFLPDLSEKKFIPWKDIEFKSYPGREQTPLPAPAPLPRITLEEALYQRKTTRNFLEKQITAEILGSLLFWSAGLIKLYHNAFTNVLRRPHPSGGERFPIEIYPAVLLGENIKPGIHHYNVVKHSLEFLADSYETVKQAIPFEFAKKSSAVLLFTLARKRVIHNENLSCKFGLIEAGHIGQNIYLVGTALGLGVLPLGGIDYPKIEQEIGLKKEEEVLFHQIAVGWPLSS